MLTNDRIINDFREQGGIQYEERVPDPTQSSLEESLAALLEFPNMWNEFQHYLINRVGMVIVRNKIWRNKLREFKSGKMQYGAVIEEVMAGLIQAREYHADENSTGEQVWGQNKLDMRTAFHRRNRQDKYKITINDAILRRAVVNEGELAKLVATQMAALQNSDQWDEFLIMCRLFEEYERNNGFYKINVPDVRALDSDGAKARLALRIMRAETDELGFYNTKYNPMGMPNFANPEELVMFVTPRFKAAIDVEALAGAFNVEKMEQSGRMVIIPEGAMNIKGAQAIITTKYFFVAHDTLIESRSLPNPDGLYTNFWLHHHGIYSVSLFESAILLTSEPVEEDVVVEYPVTAVAVPTIGRDGEDVTELLRGQVYLAETSVTTNPVSTHNQAVVWAVAGGESQHTYIDQSGILHVGADETAESLEVGAAASWLDPDDPQAVPKSNSATFTLTGDVEQIWPVPVAATEPVDPEA